MHRRESWKALAAGKAPPDATGAAGGQHVHLQFCNMIVNDSTYLLGEALEKLPQVGTHSMQCWPEGRPFLIVPQHQMHKADNCIMSTSCTEDACRHVNEHHNNHIRNVRPSQG